MATTIQISTELRDKLNERKLYENETYEEVIADLIEDSAELSEETKRDIEQSRKDLKAGRIYTLEQVRKELKL